MNKFIHQYPQLAPPQLGSKIRNLDKHHKWIPFGEIGIIIQIFEYSYKIRIRNNEYYVFKDMTEVIYDE